MSSRCCVVTFLLATSFVIATPSSSPADDIQEMVKAITDLNANMLGRRFQEAEPAARKLIALCNGPFREDPTVQVICLSLVTGLYDVQGRYGEAEPLMQRILQVGPDVPCTKENLPALKGIEMAALAFGSQHRYVEAEKLQRCCLAFHEQLAKDSFESAGPLFWLGFLAISQGREAEAELYFQQALARGAKNARPDFRLIEQGLLPLAVQYLSQGRLAEAESLIQKAVENSKKLGETSASHLSSLVALAGLREQQKKWEEAETLRKQVLDLTRKMKTLEKAAWEAIRMQELAEHYRRRGTLKTAQEWARQSIEHLQTAYSRTDRHLISPLFESARIQEGLGRLDEARGLIDRAFSILPEDPLPHYLVYRAQLSWKTGRHAEAFRDLSQAMDKAEDQRGRVSGSEQERAQVFGKMSTAFDQAIVWRADQGDVAEAFLAAERSRARALFEQLQVSGVDPLAGVPVPQAQELRKRDIEARLRVAGLQTRIGLVDEDRKLTADQRRSEREKLERNLAEARRDALVVYREIRHAGPAYRENPGKEKGPISLTAMQTWASMHEGLLLEYALTPDAGFVFVVPGDGRKPRVERLLVTKEIARALGCEPGAFTLQQAQEEAGVLLPLLSKPGQSAQSIPRLAALWQLLVPAVERESLAEGKIKHLAIVADGPLALIPFEALVLDASKPRYLLDIETPVVYGPSATVLHHLSQRPVRETTPDREPVLTVADPAYPEKETVREGPLGQLSAEARYRTARGRLQRLPQSAKESDQVAENFRRAGMKSVQLLRDQATEDGVRMNSPVRRIIHLACHGLVDQSWGNLFGALALTPGARSKTHPTDDGFLTLAEIYELDLRACELAVLSACSTNFGPQQRGEGVWGLSRGMLAAGSRRVIANNWMVEDATGSDLIQAFTGDLAEAEKKGAKPDYARALTAAQLKVRRQEKRQDPFWWASWVLLGPP
jgi:CHAT domain-containing protein